MNNTVSSSPDSTDKTTTSSMQDSSLRQEAASMGDTLRNELSSLKSDLDDLMERASNLSDEELRAARDQIMAKFSSMRHAARNMAAEANQHLNNSVEVTTDYVKEKPLQSMAIATGVGMLLGSILRR